MRHAILNEAASLTLANRRASDVHGGSGGWQIPRRSLGRGTLSGGPQESGPRRGRDAGRRQPPVPFRLTKAARPIPLAWRHGLTEETAYEWFRSIRFRDNRGEPFCPACGSLKCYAVVSRPRWWSCGKAAFRKERPITAKRCRLLGFLRNEAVSRNGKKGGLPTQSGFAPHHRPRYPTPQRAVSSAVERLVYTERVGGSKPSPPTMKGLNTCASVGLWRCPASGRSPAASTARPLHPPTPRLRRPAPAR